MVTSDVGSDRYWRTLFPDLTISFKLVWGNPGGVESEGPDVIQVVSNLMVPVCRISTTEILRSIRYCGTWGWVL